MKCNEISVYAGKRLMDLAIALPVLIFLSPVIFILVILVAIFMGRPVIFRQRRPGLLGNIFHIMKFRTMNNAKDSTGVLLSDGERLTPFGRFLRKSSLDELPELLNVIRGDMSIIGPRPLREEYLPYYTEEEFLRHSIKPGVTGLAQVSGRNLLRWEDRLALDVQYVKRVAFSLDLWILWKTIAVVFCREGASPDAAAVGENRLDHERMGILPEDQE